MSHKKFFNADNIKNLKLKEYRKIFGDFKKTFQCKELIKLIYKQQLFLCVKCKKSISLNKDCHISHLLPISCLTVINRKDLINDYRNLSLQCSTCNLKQNDKLEFELIKDNILELLTIKEIAIIKYNKNYKFNIKEIETKLTSKTSIQNKEIKSAD